MGFLVLGFFWTWYVCRRAGITGFLFGQPRTLPDVELRPMPRRNTPQELLETMSIYTWPGPRSSHETTTVGEAEEVNAAEPGTGGHEDPPIMHDQQMDVEAATGIRRPEPALINRAVDQSEPAANLRRCLYGQTTCAICLEDFVAGSSQVRELPCGHFFDRACIDPYLLGHSNQCPVCKTSVLVSRPVEVGATQGPQ